MDTVCRLSALIPLLTFTIGALCAGEAAEAPPETAEAARARVVLRALEASRVGDALVEAQAAVRRFPESGILRRRLAQAQLADALRTDAALEPVTQHLRFNAALAHVHTRLRDPLLITTDTVKKPEQLAAV